MKNAIEPSIDLPLYNDVPFATPIRAASESDMLRISQLVIVNSFEKISAVTKKPNIM
jgi:hypothetical protein